MDYRLPATVVPSRYDIRLEPDLEAATFAGEETVAITVTEPVTEIVLNAAELAIQSVTVITADGTTVEGSAALDEADERARLLFPSPIPAGEHRLTLRFTGILNDRLHGFYRSTYKDAAGRLPRHRGHPVRGHRRAARLPVLGRARVQGGVRRHPRGPGAAGRGLEHAGESARRPPGRAKKTVVFADTIRMSTYLVAFVVGELEATAPVMVGPTPLRVWCVPGKLHLARFALEIGAFSLDFFERYYGMPYPGDKLDLLAIPDFAAGAMENLGAITFRETALLVDETAASHTELRAGGRRGGPRDRPHVVRRSRHHGVVERDLAERGLRHLHGAAGGGRLEARVEALDDLRRVAGRRDGGGRPAQHPAHRVRGAGAARLRGDVRPAHLREGRARSCACSSST